VSLDLSPYSETVREKIERISDILVQMNKVLLLKDHLSFLGGTALNFLYLNAPRLSVDLDFNYRQMDKRDWGEIRDDIDRETKRILYDLGYVEEDVKIQPTYNLCRFYIQYINTKGVKDSIKIETGYMRRIPILKSDTFKEFIHPLTDQRIEVKTPLKEELFANKYCTMFSRKSISARDIYDVYSISSAEFDIPLFIDVVLIESIFMNIDIISFPLETLFKGIQTAQIQDLVAEEIDWKMVNEKVKSFIEKVQNELKKRDYPEFLSGFHNHNKINLDQLSNKSELNEGLEHHPLLFWLIEKKK
jgi:predicted nucleotidyltransferase component of viral defense system